MRNKGQRSSETQWITPSYGLQGPLSIVTLISCHAKDLRKVGHVKDSQRSSRWFVDFLGSSASSYDFALRL